MAGDMSMQLAAITHVMRRDTVLHSIRESGALSDRVLDGLRADWPHQTELLPGLKPFLGDLEKWLKQLDAVSTEGCSIY